MTYQLNDKVKNLVPYDAVAGDFQIRLDANESFINPGVLLKDQIAEAVAKVSLNRYPDFKATELCKKFGEFYGVDPDRVVAGNGSDELITVIMGAFLQHGDKLLTFSPDFSMYQFYAEIYEKMGVVVAKNDDLTLTAEKAIDTIKAEQPDIVILSNPCSPTSLVLKREEIIKIIQSTSALVVIDEAYMEFSDQSILDVSGQFDNLVVLKTCSKALGCAAVRLGFAVSSKEITKALHCVRSPYNVNAVTQAIGCVIFSNPQYIKSAINEIKAARDYLYQGLIALKEYRGVKKIVKPETNFIFMELTDAEWAYQELMKESIIVRKLGSYLRITAGTKQENDSLIAALSNILGRMPS